MVRIAAGALRLDIAVTAFLVIAVSAGTVWPDSIFDFRGTGQDIVPVAGSSRCLGGAVAATDDPLSVAVMNPYASALTDKVTFTIGFVHGGTQTKNFDEEKRTAASIFPTLSVTVPIKGISFMTGIFLERAGRLTMADTGYAYVDEVYDADYKKEVSAQAVPFYVSTEIMDRLVLSGGFIYSAFDGKWTTEIDYRSDDLSDADDAIDLSASGVSFAGGMMLDLDRVRLAGLYRGKADLEGNLDRDNLYGGVWSSEDTRVTSEPSFKVGVWANPVEPLVFEVDYDRSPWSMIEIDGVPISDKRSERWSAGFEYRGDHLWEASRIPLCFGYYRQPIDWESRMTGDIVHEVYSLGTYIRLGDGRAGLSATIEFGRKYARETSDFDEKTIGLSLSLSAIEAWRREVRR
jgi:hypothetical protein